MFQAVKQGVQRPRDTTEGSHCESKLVEPLLNWGSHAVTQVGLLLVRVGSEVSQGYSLAKQGCSSSEGLGWKP